MLQLVTDERLLQKQKWVLTEQLKYPEERLEDACQKLEVCIARLFAWLDSICF